MSLQRDIVLLDLVADFHCPVKTETGRVQLRGRSSNAKASTTLPVEKTIYIMRLDGLRWSV